MRRLTRLACFLLLAAASVLPAACSAESRPPSREIASYPISVDPTCRDGAARLYDECADQLTLIDVALARAKAESRSLLVSYGAEWCIWCHVFKKYVQGETSRFEYRHASPDAPKDFVKSVIHEREKSDVGAAAAALNAFAADNFVLVHIDAQYAPHGYEVLERTGADAFYEDSFPFIFAVNASGGYVGHVRHEVVQVRRESDDWFRGYDRARLIAELERLRAAAGPASSGSQDGPL